jgi:hypothetical protein
MTLRVEEFLRRFFLHVLPPGFVRIRHFGLFTNRLRKVALELWFGSRGSSYSTVNDSSAIAPAALMTAKTAIGRIQIP